MITPYSVQSLSYDRSEENWNPVINFISRVRQGGITNMKPTKAQFEEYIEIRNSGVTNMYDFRYIVDISETGLTRPICVYIMEHFLELAEEYDVDIWE